MDIVKKNLVSIIMGVIATLGVVAVYVWPTPGLYVKLKGLLDDRVRFGASVTGLLSRPRTLPLLSVDVGAQPDSLDGFPNTQVTEAGQAAIDKLHKQADQMYQNALTTNQKTHKVLLDGALPSGDDNHRYDYAKAYGDQVNKYARWQAILNSKARPVKDDITAALAAERSLADKNHLIYDSKGQVDPDSKTSADAEYNARALRIPLELQQQTAESASIYLEDKSLLGVDNKKININNPAPPSPEDICDTQFNLWCIDDVASAIAACNNALADPAQPGGPQVFDVLHDPIKNLEQMSAIVPIAGVDNPATPVSPLHKLPGSITQRGSNGVYDVFLFSVKMIVDAEKLPQIIRQMESGRFLTVCVVHVWQVEDPAVDAVKGFRYGDKPCIEVEFLCEDLFMHQWTDAILPDTRKPNFGKQAVDMSSLNLGGTDIGTGDTGGDAGDQNAVQPSR